MISQKSVFKRGRITSASGSPKRALNSIVLIPCSVNIKPPYRKPVNGWPSFTIAFAIGIIMECMASSIISGVILRTGEYTPIPPVLGPLSPS